ncbi:hypothetical protein ACSNOI_24895 [Actinomadura kijaniata]|uniref:hypothetical protein n=1 Tax=Actinomadura kijaniata TaxID=46161 RepID=UPI003F1A1EC9
MKRKKRSDDEAGRRPRAAALGGGLAGAAAGRMASRMLRGPAGRIARRTGLPAATVTRIIEVAAPVALSAVAARWAGRGNRGRAAPEPPGPIPVEGGLPYHDSRAR